MNPQPLYWRAKVGHYFRSTLKTAAATAVLALALISALKADGAWKFLDQDNEHVQYVDGDRTIFWLGCSKYTGFSAVYPDQSRKGGQAKVQLANGKTALNFTGTLQPDDNGTVDITVILDDVSVKPVDQVVALLGAGLPITVSAAKGSYALPAPTIEDFKKRFGEAC